MQMIGFFDLLFWRVSTYLHIYQERSEFINAEVSGAIL